MISGLAPLPHIFGINQPPLLVPCGSNPGPLPVICGLKPATLTSLCGHNQAPLPVIVVKKAQAFQLFFAHFKLKGGSVGILELIFMAKVGPGEELLTSDQFTFNICFKHMKLPKNPMKRTLFSQILVGEGFLS